MYFFHTTSCKLVCRELHGTKMPGHTGTVLGDELSHYKKSSKLKRLHLKLFTADYSLYLCSSSSVFSSSHNGWTLSVTDCNSGIQLSFGQLCSIIDSTCWYFSRQPSEEEH